MQNPPILRWLPATTLACGIALSFVPPDATRPLRNLVRDALRPGQLAVHATADTVRHWLKSPMHSSETPQSAAARDEELRSLRLSNRQLEIQSARLREKVKDLTEQSGLSPVSPIHPPLATIQLIEARVMGAETAALWRGKQFLAAGAKNGVAESALVLENSRPLVDLGNDADISPGDAVYAGRIVIGKIADVGRYSSTLRLVTDPGYSGRARLARRTSRGLLAFGAEGTLVADGSELCRLTHITDPVNVGDEVFTGGADGVLPTPMYYGQVVRAELEPGAQDWSVWVKPAAATVRLETILILRRAANPERILAN
ncbi:MAG TPA: rod shape-determining protein MreC [Planctomycetaceae bacterium]|jgi:cell shape-determining protein MreC